ncbi:MAG: nicotinate-nucleotide--dimethylbenzimidazole phosphoribosyltransferase [Candidatus Omnitrophica bacterium]|nr:nicotinate-nucleotide--dimethylbenzimidazole phosphoribosyltransferase [Candidatus Omnitrophota bacterium]
MNKIEEVISRITAPQRLNLQLAQQVLDNLTKPKGSLGRLEELACRIAAISGSLRPTLEHKVIFTLAADHGVAAKGVSAFPREVTAQMVYNFLRGGAAINVLAQHAGARVVVADLGVAAQLKPSPGLIVKKVALGTSDMSEGPAMSRAQAILAVESGIGIFEEEYAKGTDIIGTGEMGIGNTSAATAITHVFTGIPVRRLTGRGTGVDDRGLRRKISVIGKAVRVNSPKPDDPLDVLAKVGGFEIAALCGIILAACARRVPVVIDGFISGAAALCAFHLHPVVRDYLIAGHCSVEPGHRALLVHLRLKPLFDLEMRLGEGTGAALGIWLAEASVGILTRMATFKDAKVSRSPEGGRQGKV